MGDLGTCIAAQMPSFGMVRTNPNSERRRNNNPGAKSKMFIFMEIAKLPREETKSNFHFLSLKY